MAKTNTSKEKIALWVGWAKDALAKYELPDKLDNVDEEVDDMVEVTTKYADSMLDEYETRFEGGRGGRRRRKSEDEDEEPEEDEDPED